MPLPSAGQIMEFGEKKALQCVTGTTFATITTYLALITNTPNATDLTMAAETEYNTSTGYARLAYAPGTPTSASPSVIGNGGTLTWGPFTSAPGTCTFAILCDALTGTTANAIAAFLLANARTPLTGDSLTAAISSFTIQV
jgi:hypothetical protein